MQIKICKYKQGKYKNIKYSGEKTQIQAQHRKIDRVINLSIRSKLQDMFSNTKKTTIQHSNERKKFKEKILETEHKLK